MLKHNHFIRTVELYLSEFVRGQRFKKCILTRYTIHSMQSTNLMAMLMVIKNDSVMKPVIMLFIVDMTVKAELLEK